METSLLQNVWRTFSGSEAQDDIAHMEVIELYILRLKPRSHAEAALMLDVVISQGGEGRADEMDICALRNLRHWHLESRDTDQKIDRWAV